MRVSARCTVVAALLAMGCGSSSAPGKTAQSADDAEVAAGVDAGTPGKRGGGGGAFGGGDDDAGGSGPDAPIADDASVTTSDAPLTPVEDATVTPIEDAP